ncbi:MAG: DUF211 domain-containing protein [Pseudomonadota bacterium]|nr:DUF211 domain-containing protein [Pseudomonadota bacterium]
MPAITRVVLDILKPHHPTLVEFAAELSEHVPGVLIRLNMVEMDEKTETLLVTVEGRDIPVGRLFESIAQLGGSLHSVDEVEVDGREG